MEEVYTAAVVGAGAGGKLSMRALMASPRFKLVAAADLSESALHEAGELYPDIQTYANH